MNLVAENLSYKPDEQFHLNEVSFNFKKGNIYSLVGPSGSGKSTLLNLLSLIDRPTSGTIKILNNTICLLYTSDAADE